MVKNLIVFDIDGTLSDSVQIHQEAFIQALKEIGVTNLPKSLNTFKHHTDSYISKYIYESITSHTFTAEILDTFQKSLFSVIKKSAIEEIKGAKQLLQEIELTKEIGYCFATGSMLLPAKYKLDQIVISFHEDQLVTADTHYSREDIVLTAIDQAKKYYKVNHFERVISIGDGIWDLKTAFKLNLDFIGIGIKNQEVMQANGMKEFYKDLNDIKIETFM